MCSLGVAETDVVASLIFSSVLPHNTKIVNELFVPSGLLLSVTHAFSEQLWTNKQSGWKI